MPIGISAVVGHEPRLLLELAPGRGKKRLARIGDALWNVPTRRSRRVAEQQDAPVGDDDAAAHGLIAVQGRIPPLTPP